MFKYKHVLKCISKLQRLWWPLNYTSVKHDSVAALQAFLKRTLPSVAQCKNTQTLITLAPVYILTSSTTMGRFENLIFSFANCDKLVEARDLKRHALQMIGR